MARTSYAAAYAWGAYERLKRLVALLVSAKNPDGTDASIPVEIASGSVTLITSDSVTERGGTITAGGASQPVTAANAGRKYFFFQNLSSGDLWIRFSVTAAAASQPSIKIAPGGYYESGVFVPRNDVQVYGATTGQAFAALEA